jgi:hypothetical protein
MSFEDKKYDSEVPVVIKSSPRAETILPEGLGSFPVVQKLDFGSDIPLYVPSQESTILGAPNTVPLDPKDIPLELAQRTVPLRLEDLPPEALRTQSKTKVVPSSSAIPNQSGRLPNAAEEVRNLGRRSGIDAADRIIDELVKDKKSAVNERRFMINSALIVALGLAGVAYYAERNAMALHLAPVDAVPQISPSESVSTKPSVSASASVSAKPVLKPLPTYVPVNPDKDLDDMDRAALCDEYVTLRFQHEEGKGLRRPGGRPKPPPCMGDKEYCSEVRKKWDEDQVKKAAADDAAEKASKTRYERLSAYVHKHGLVVSCGSLR